MTRIRYEKTNGMLVTKEFVAIGQLVKVVINEKLMEVQVLNSQNETLFESVKQKDLTAAKKLVKNTLIGMGVLFQPEVRPRFEKTKLSDLNLITADFGAEYAKNYKDDLFEDEEGEDFI